MAYERTAGIREFEDFIRPYRDIWKSLELRWLAVAKAGRWFNLVSVAYLLLSGADIDSSEIVFDNPVLRAGKQILRGERIDGFLESAGTGAVETGHLTLELRTPRGETVRDPITPDRMDEYHWTSAGRGLDSWWPGKPSPEPETFWFAVGGRGGNAVTLLDNRIMVEMERALIANDPPYMGLTDLVNFFVRSDNPVGPGATPSLVVAAPLYSRLLSPEFDKSEGPSIDFEGPNVAAPSDYRFALRRWTPDNDRRSILRADPVGEISAYLRRYRAHIPLEGAHFFEAHLLFRDRKIDSTSFWVAAPRSLNPRVNALKSTQLGIERLAISLGSGTEKLRSSDAFEVAVGLLLGLCGFQVVPLDLKAYSMGDSPDLLAFVPYTKLTAAVEVTLAEVSADKIVRFSARATSIGNELADHTLARAFVTYRDSCSQNELQLARDNGAAILGLVELRHLYQMAEANEPPPRCHAYVMSRVGKFPGGP